MEKISVIIPVYNSGEELSRCLESVLNQTYKNIEIILINDGSTDNSLEICKEYELKYDNVKVFTQSNQGQSAARNRGIDNASGAYIGFVDSDDIIHHQMYEYLYSLMNQYQADLSSVQIATVNHVNEIEKLSGSVESIEVVEKNELLVDYMYDGLNKPAGQYSAGRKLFKAHLMDHVRFLEGKINEDILFNYEILENTYRLVKSERVMYYYFQDSDSTMRRTFSEKELDLLYICDILIDKATEEQDSELIELAHTKKSRSYFSLLAKIAYFGTNIPEKKLNEIKNMLIKGLRQNYQLLMKSPIPLNRKIIVTAFAINFNMSQKLIQMVRK